MQARDIMTRDPRSCSIHHSIKDIAVIMREANVGEVPVVDEQCRLLGVITDSDIAVRCVAAGDHPESCHAQDYMTAPAQWLQEDASPEEVANLMIDQAIRRVPIADEDGTLCGMIALADLERTKARSLSSRVSRHVSRSH